MTNEIKPKNLGDNPVFLGQGYATDMQMGAMSDNCFAPGNIKQGGTPEAIVEFSNAISFEEVEKQLHINVQESSKIGMFSESASATYVQQIQEDQYSQSFHYLEKIYLPTQMWSPNNAGTEALTSYGQAIYQQEPANFRLVCGDEIVTSTNMGISFYASMEITFSSFSDKQTFQANAGANFGSIIDVSGQVQKMVSQYNLNGEVSVYGFQQGGDPSLLPQIFAKNAGGYYVTSCSLQDLQACQGTINGVLTYATSNLPNQTRTDSGVMLDYATQNVAELLLLNVGNSTVTPQVESAREWLGGAYLNQTAQVTFVGHLLGSPFMSAQWIEADILNELNNQYSNLKNNLGVLEDTNSGAISCYSDPVDCVSTQTTIQQNLTPLNNSFINQFETGYNAYNTDSKGSFDLITFYPSGKCIYQISAATAQPAPPVKFCFSLIGPAILSSIAFIHNNQYDCGNAQEMLPEFPDQYNISYAPNEPYWQCSLEVYGTYPRTVIYDMIDNPL